MAQKGRSKGVSYYFRIELNTLQGKITSGFCFLGVLAAIMMAIAAWIIHPALVRSQYIVGVLDASDHQLMQVSANTDRSIALAHIKVLGDEQFTPENLTACNKSILEPLDSLAILSRQWQGSEAAMCLKLIEVKTERILKTLKEISITSSPEKKARLVQEELPPLQKTIQNQVQKIQRIHTAERKDIGAYIDYRSDNLVWIMLACLCMSIIIGGVYATYIVVRVLAEIRMLKSKILEISEGKLIPRIPESKNELNSIIKALNILNENLHSIRDFAHEVGTGNFDTNISVFNGQHELGESLANMRDSLKTVALEEKQRSWVASGQAHFSELLRASTTDLSAYYQSIISELVKHLKVNQAALYILENQDGGEPVLEMKSSYAYGRLKYQYKTLEPGQGLVGQVFLEKKPLFLNNIPQNFLQISSGLGEASPNHLVVIPLKVNETVNGVLELASFHKLAAFEIEFLLKIAENISGALYNVNTVQTTSRLLEEAQQMAYAMQAQEEMLRQNSEELIATQEQLNRDLQETNQKVVLLENSLKHAPFAQLLINQSGNIQEINKKAAEFFGSKQLNLHISSLLQAPELMQWIMQAREHSSYSMEYQHPQKGNIKLQLQAFTAGQQLYFNLLLVPQESFSAA